MTFKRGKLRHFDRIGKGEKTIVSLWLDNAEAKTEEEQRFLDDVRKGLEVISYDYRIANLEPSLDEDGNLFYEEGREVHRWWRTDEWIRGARNFAPEHKSRMALKCELFIWYAYRVAIGFWDLTYLCNTSIGSGKYFYIPNDSPKFATSGAREIGGAKDGVENTCKLVLDECGNVLMCGVHYNKKYESFPLTSYDKVEYPSGSCGGSVAVIVLES